MPKGIPNKPAAKKATAKKATAKKATTKKAAKKTIEQMIEEALEQAERKRSPLEPEATLEEKQARVEANVGQAVASGVGEQLDEVGLEVLLPRHEIQGLTQENPRLVLVPVVLSRDVLVPLYPAYWRAYYPNRPGSPPSFDSPEAKKFLREFFTSNLRGMLLEDSHKVKALQNNGKLGVEE